MINSLPKALTISAIASGLLLLGGCTDAVEAQNSVASVGGTTISEPVLDIYSNGRYRKPAAELTPEEREAALSELKDLYLLANLADEKGIDREADVIAQLTLQRKSVLAQAYVNDFLANNPASDEEILAEYKKLTAENPDTQYKARHILVETEEAAVEIIAALDKGANFEELAKERSTGPSGPQGGDLGWFAPDAMVAEFSAAVVALEDNKYTMTPVQTQFGYHVILREGTRENAPPAFDDVKEQVRPAVEQRKFQEFLDKQKELAGIS